MYDQPQTITYLFESIPMDDDSTTKDIVGPPGAWGLIREFFVVNESSNPMATAMTFGLGDGTDVDAYADIDSIPALAAGDTGFADPDDFIARIVEPDDTVVMSVVDDQTNTGGCHVQVVIQWSDNRPPHGVGLDGT